MDNRQIIYFLAVVKFGSFSQAAEELYISQSSLSKQIIALEKELELLLFDRSKRKIALSPAGEVFLPHARSFNTTYREMLADLKEFQTLPPLSIVTIPVMAQYGIASHIAQFEANYPGIKLILEEREAVSILGALNNRQYDLGFIRNNYLDTKSFASLNVAKDKFLMVVSKKHRFASRASLSLQELSNENFIMFDKGTVVHELAVDACRAAGFEPRIFYASFRVESVLGLVASNTGIALMMEKIFNYSSHPDVVAIPLDETIESNIVLVWRKNKNLLRGARLFIDFMKKNVAA